MFVRKGMSAESIQGTFDAIKGEEGEKKAAQEREIKKIQDKKRQVQELESTAQKADVVEGKFDWTRKYAVMEKWEVQSTHLGECFQEDFAQLILRRT